MNYRKEIIMGLYAVRVIEVSGKTVITEAENFAEAKDKVESAWQNTEIIFDADDFSYVEFKASDNFKEKEINPNYKDLDIYERV
jgi:hypothetical protein